METIEYMKNTILVTGGAGFIGSHLCKKLLRMRYRVILLDKFQKSRRKEFKLKNIQEIIKQPGLSIIDTDILDSVEVEKVFRSQNISSIVHLASRASVADSIKDPRQTISVNLNGAISLFEKARQYKVKHVVFASSALVYGSKAPLPMSEEDPCINLTSPYAVSLRAVELMAEVFSRLHHISITGFRLFPVIGPQMRQELFLPVVVRAILTNASIEICGDGKTMRTYTYIDDIITGIISSIGRGEGYQVINLGSTKPISLLDLIHIVEKQLKTKAKIIFAPQRFEEIMNLYPSINKAKKKLEFQPRVGIEEGIKRYIDWYLTNNTL